MATNARRISPQEAHQHLESSDAMLVCAYDSPQEFERNHLEGATSLNEFQGSAESMPRDREVIFYCA
jgi:rhodanese-related sulfurtransferase